MTANSYNVTAKATDSKNNTASSTPATINVINNTPPTVSMTASPANATAPATIILNATATDTDGTVAQVEFFNGSTSIAVITQAPYSTNWTNVAAGSYSITAKATDNLGATTTSASVPVAVTANVPKVYDVHNDQLGTPRVITDSTGTEVWRWDSAPFGETPPNEQPANQASKFSFNMRFPGQYFDAETNLHYNYFRDYDPATGRYVESDRIGLAGGINTYAYVEVNPMKYIDPLGLVKHTTGRTISCGKCTIRIDYTFDERTGIKKRHLHWDCKGKEGSCGEHGDKSHDGSWDDAPEIVKECARKAGFQGDSEPEPSSKNYWQYIGGGIAIGIGLIFAPEVTGPALILGGAASQ